MRWIPNPGIISTKRKYSMTTSVNKNDISANRIFREFGKLAGIKMSCIWFTTMKNLEGVAVKMDYCQLGRQGKNMDDLHHHRYL
jgi:hypothetical protein